MHTKDHIVKDSLKCLIKSSSDHKNRTEKYTVRMACQNANIFPLLWKPETVDEPAPWTVSRYVMKHHDLKLLNVIGALSVEIPKRILHKGKGRNSQETIMYAVDGWANWCLFAPEENDTARPYIESKLELFDCISILNSSRIKWSDINSIQTKLVDALVKHSALFPPTEQTYAFHEIIHVCSQIPKIGPPKFNNLFMFERINWTLKQMIKNKCNSMASIVKAYAVSFSLYHILNTS